MSISNPPGLPESSISNPLNKELLYFKEDILRDLKSIESKINIKIKHQIEEIDKKLLNFETKNNNITQRIFELSNKFADSEKMKLNIDNLLSFRSKIDEILFSHEVQTNTLSKELKEAINKYDKIITDNIYYPGIVGASGCRFNTMHNFIDYVLTNIKDKTFQMDLKSYKVKIDGIVESMKRKIEEVILNNNLYTNNALEKLEKKINNILNIHEEKLISLRMENTKSYQNLDKHTKNLMDELDQIRDMKSELIEIFNGNISDMKHTLNINEIKYNEFQKDFYILQSQFTDLKEWLKTSKLIGKEMPARLKNDISYKSKMTHAESFLKKYIEGEVTMKDMRSLVHKKSNDKEKNECGKVVGNMFIDENKFNIIGKNENLSDNYRFNGSIKSKDFKNLLKSNNKNNNDLFLNNNYKTPSHNLKKSLSENKIRFNFGNKKEKNEIINKSNEVKLQDEEINNDLLENNTSPKNEEKNNLPIIDHSNNKYISEKNIKFNQISNFDIKNANNDIIDINYDQQFTISCKKINNANNKNDKNNKCIEKNLSKVLLRKSSNDVIREIENENDNNPINSNNSSIIKNKEIKNNDDTKINKSNDENLLLIKKDKKSDSINNPINTKSNNNTKRDDSFTNFHTNLEQEIIQIKQNNQQNNDNTNNPPTSHRIRSSSSSTNIINVDNQRSEDKKNTNDISTKNNNDINQKNKNNYIKKEIIDNKKKEKNNQNVMNAKDKAILHKILKGERESFLTFTLRKKEDKTDIKSDEKRNNVKTPVKSNTFTNRFFNQDNNIIQGKLHIVNFPNKKKIKLKEAKNDENEGIKIINTIRQISKDYETKRKKISYVRSADKIYCVKIP